MNETDILIEEQFKKLPLNLQRAIKIVPWKALVREIGQANTLDTEQILALEQETMFIIYGFEDPRDYVSNLTSAVGIDETAALAIAETVSEKIFNIIESEAEKETEKAEPVKLDSVENLHDENSAENIRKILKANLGEDRDRLTENQLKKLPEELQQVIKTVPWRSVVKEIALLNKLDLAQIVAVERETMFVIYGFEDEKNYLSNIMREANLDETVATAITTALNERILKVIINKARESKSIPPKTSANIPEIPPINLPMVEKGETVHDVPQIEPKALSGSKAPLPDYRYHDGKDPYREPLV